MNTFRFAAAVLAAPLTAVIVGPLFSAYLSFSLDRPFAPHGLANTVGAFGISAVILAYVATLVCSPIAIYIARRRQSRPGLKFTMLCGAIAGAVTPELSPWVWFLQGPVGSPLFFVYVGLGVLAGSLVAGTFWAIAFAYQPKRLAA